MIDRLTPAIDCTSVVSAVSRDSTSPMRVTSKKRRIHADDACIHGGAQVRDHALAEPRDEIEAQRRENTETPAAARNATKYRLIVSLLPVAMPSSIR